MISDNFNNAIVLYVYYMGYIEIWIRVYNTLGIVDFCLSMGNSNGWSGDGLWFGGGIMFNGSISLAFSTFLGKDLSFFPEQQGLS